MAGQVVHQHSSAASSSRAPINRSAPCDLMSLVEETGPDGSGYPTITGLGETFELGSTDEQRHA
jgi:hypothetical protein